MYPPPPLTLFAENVQPTVREPTRGARHVVGSSGDGAEVGEEGSEEQKGAAGGIAPPSEGGEQPEAPEMPELLNPTREELERAFPNAPKAPYPTLPDPRGFTAEQLAAGGSLPVSYGGQVRVLDGIRFSHGCVLACPV